KGANPQGASSIQVQPQGSTQAQHPELYGAHPTTTTVGVHTGPKSGSLLQCPYWSRSSTPLISSRGTYWAETTWSSFWSLAWHHRSQSSRGEAVVTRYEGESRPVTSAVCRGRTGNTSLPAVVSTSPARTVTLVSPLC